MARGRNLQIVSETLKSRGWSDQAINALGGGFMQESGGSGDLNPNASHDGNTGYGIAGYRDPKPGQGRWTGLKNFASANGFDVNDPVTQALYADHELGGSGAPGITPYKGPGFGSEKRAGDMIRNAPDLRSAARGAIAFERPQGFSWDNPEGGHGWLNRLNHAERLAGVPLSVSERTPLPALASNSAPPTTVPAAPVTGALAGAAPPVVTPEQPAATGSDNLGLSLADLGTMEGWGKIADSTKVQDIVKDTIKSVRNEQDSNGAEFQITPTNLTDDFASRFSAASQLMPISRRLRGPLSS